MLKLIFSFFTFSQQFSHCCENMCIKGSNARSSFKQWCFSKILSIPAKIVEKICTEIHTTRQFSENLVKYMTFFTFSRQKKMSSSFHPYARVWSCLPLSHPLLSLAWKWWYESVVTLHFLSPALDPSGMQVQYTEPVFLNVNGAHAGIDSKEWIPPAYVAWRAGTITLFLLGS